MFPEPRSLRAHDPAGEPLLLAESRFLARPLPPAELRLFPADAIVLRRGGEFGLPAARRRAHRRPGRLARPRRRRGSRRPESRSSAGAARPRRAAAAARPAPQPGRAGGQREARKRSAPARRAAPAAPAGSARPDPGVLPLAPGRRRRRERADAAPRRKGQGGDSPPGSLHAAPGPLPPERPGRAAGPGAGRTGSGRPALPGGPGARDLALGRLRPDALPARALPVVRPARRRRHPSPRPAARRG